MDENVMNIEDLQQDSKNFNKGTEQGQTLMEQSFTELGAGRSILIDKNGNIIAGNKSQKAAMKAGIKRVRVIETDGTELVAVKRTDIDIDSADGRKLALLDNLTNQVNLTWDKAELSTVQSELDGFDVGDFGFEVDTMPEFSFDTGEKQGEGSQQKDPTNSELDVDGFGDKIKMVLELSIEEHAFIQQRLSQDGMTKEQVLLNLLGYAEQ